MLRQAVPASADDEVVDLFGVRDAFDTLRRAEAGEMPAGPDLDPDWSLRGRAATALARLGLDIPLETRLDALSGGQRTRAALAAILYGQPDFLLLDEPTNTQK